MTYQVEFCTEASPDGNPDGAKYESVYFTDHKKAIRFAKENIRKDIHGEVHIRHFEEDIYGREYFDEETEIVTG